MSEIKFRYFTIPNIITLLNLTAGSIAVVVALTQPENLIYASYLLGASLIFDFLDGLSARALKISSEIGKELDSFADLISFGLAPAAIVFQLLKISVHVRELSFDLPGYKIAVLLLPVIIVAFSALRLAKFNLDTRQTTSFIGLPTPALAAFFASLPLMIDFNLNDLIIFSHIFDTNHPSIEVAGLVFIVQAFVLESLYFYIPFVLVFSTLLLIEMPMFSLKFKNLAYKENRIRYIFLSISFLLILFFQVIAIPFIIILFIIMSLIQNALNTLIRKNTGYKHDLLG